MHEFGLDIASGSQWVTATPGELAREFCFFVTEIGRFMAGKNYFTRRAEKETYLLLYTLSGEGALKTRHGQARLPEGSAVLIHCWEYHEYFNNSRAIWDFFWAHIDGTGLEGIAKLLSFAQQQAVNIHGKKAFYALFEEILGRSRKNSIQALSENSLDIHRLLQTMVRDSRPQAAQGQQHKEEVGKILRYIESNYDHQMTIEDMLRQVHLSKYYVIRLFKQYMGITPYHYLVNYRINQSKILLRSSRKSIGEIALEVGFLDSSNFIHQFKKQTGMRPGEYRKDFT